jgi:hypothetical protein
MTGADITCSSCRHKNRAHRGYCGRCGTSLQPVCRGCHFVNEVGDAYCGGCGNALVAHAATFAKAAPASAARVPSLSASALGASAVGASPVGAAALGAIPVPLPPATAAVPPSLPKLASSPRAQDAELAALFAPARAASPDDELPAANITQADLDRLFGGKT